MNARLLYCSHKIGWTWMECQSDPKLMTTLDTQESGKGYFCSNKPLLKGVILLSGKRCKSNGGIFVPTGFTWKGGNFYQPPKMQEKRGIFSRPKWRCFGYVFWVQTHWQEWKQPFYRSATPTPTPTHTGKEGLSIHTLLPTKCMWVTPSRSIV